MNTLKIIIEKHEDGYTAYPIGIGSIIVGQGNSSEEAVNDLQSAINFHIETFGADILQETNHIQEVSITELALAP